MRFGSLCSGIEAATVAWSPLGWETAFVAEIEKFTSSVLKHRYPNVPNLGDITKDDFVERAKECAPIDLLCGGTPCQSFSVAGLRKSMTDDRGNITSRFLEISHELRPTWIVWENVPGVLNTEDNAFGCFLSGLVGHDAPFVSRSEGGGWPSAGIVTGPRYGAAWRVLDAQYFGVPQRRRRVWVVGYLGDWRPAAKVLFEPPGVCRDLTEGEEEREGSTSVFETCPDGSGREAEVSPALDTRSKDGPRRNQGGVIISSESGHGLFTDGFGTIRSHGGSAGDGSENLITHTLRGEGFDASEDGSGRGTPIIPIDTTQITSKSNYSNPKPGDPCHPLAAGAHPPVIAFSSKDHGGDYGEKSPTIRSGNNVDGNENGVVPPAVIYDMRGNGDGDNSPTITGDHAGRPTDYTPMVFEPWSIARNAGPKGLGENSPTLRSEMGDNQPAVRDGMTVRRLTPRECERLQDFPSWGKLDIIEACLPSVDNQKNDVNAEIECLRWRIDAYPVEERELNQSAWSAEFKSKINHPGLEKRVVLSVRIDYEQNLIQILSLKKCLLSASLAGEQDSSTHRIKGESIALLIALSLSEGDKKILTGKVEFQQSVNHSTDPRSGVKRRKKSGPGKCVNVKDAGMSGEESEKSTMSTISEAGQNFKNSGLTSITLPSSVINAIGSFIPSSIKKENSFVFAVSRISGHTQIPWGKKTVKDCPDGPRYKSIGNSWAACCANWIGKRIQLVEDSKK